MTEKGRSLGVEQDVEDLFFELLTGFGTNVLSADAAAIETSSGRKMLRLANKLVVGKFSTADPINFARWLKRDMTTERCQVKTSILFSTSLFYLTRLNQSLLIPFNL